MNWKKPRPAWVDWPLNKRVLFGAAIPLGLSVLWVVAAALPAARLGGNALDLWWVPLIVVGAAILGGLNGALAPRFVIFAREERSIRKRLVMAGVLTLAFIAFMTLIFGVSELAFGGGFDAWMLTVWTLFFAGFQVIWACFPPPELIGRAACGGCGYERPAMRNEHNERCSECANQWWLPEKAGDRTRLGARSLERHPKRTWRQSMCFGVAGSVVFAIFAAPVVLSLSPVLANTPTPVLRTVAGFATTRSGSAAFEELVRRGHLTTAEYDELLTRAMDVRRRPRALPFDTQMAIEDAMKKSLFSQALVDHWFEEEVSFELVVEVDTGAGVIRPALHARILASITMRGVDIVALGVRINDGPWQQPLGRPTEPKRIAHTYEAYDNFWRDTEPETEQFLNDLGQHAPHFKPIPLPADLPPGEHTLTIRFRLFAQDLSRSQGWPWQFFTPDGDAVTIPGALWQETRDITTTFTIP